MARLAVPKTQILTPPVLSRQKIENIFVAPKSRTCPLKQFFSTCDDFLDEFFPNPSSRQLAAFLRAVMRQFSKRSACPNFGSLLRKPLHIVLACVT